MSLEKKLMLINESNELQRQINSLKQKIYRNHRSKSRSINNYVDYFNTPNQVGTGKMYMLNPKSKSDISLEIREKPYSRSRKQLNPDRGISKKEFNLVITDTEHLIPLYNTNTGLIEMTADEVAETIRFCELEITQEQLEASTIHILPELNLEEARHLLKVIDWMKF